MFDLFRSRDKAVRILLGGLLLVVALSMVTYLIPNYGSTEGSAQDPIVAEVGGDKITTRNAQIVIQQALRSKSMSPAMIPILIPQMVDQMITERALAYQAERMGFHVSEEQVSNAIRLTIPQLFPEGKFVGRDIYAAMLAQQNLTIQDFETDMARQLLVTRLREVAVEGTVVAQADVEAEFRQRNEKVTIEYAMITPEKFRSEVKVTDADAQAYYEKNRGAYKIPERRSVAILVIDQARLEQSLASKDADLRRLYESDKDRFRTGERVKARHILLNTTGKSADEEIKIKAKAEDLLKQVKAGGNFAELAKKNSEDPGTKDKGGNLDWVVKGQTVPEFEKALFALKPNEISGLVKTQYGFHIIQALEKQDAHLKTFDEVKAGLLTELKNQLGQDRIQSALDAAAAELKKNPQQIDQVASRLKFNVVNVEKAGAGDPIPEIGVNRDFEDAVGSLKKGEVSQAVAAPGNRMIIAVITDVFPAHPSTFEEAQNQIRPALTQVKANQLVVQRAAELAAKVKAMNGDLKKAAQSMGLQVVNAPEFNRAGAIEGLGSPDAIPEIFTKPAGTVFGPTSIGMYRVVGKVSARIDPNLAELPAQTDSIREEIKKTKARERNALFEDGLRQQLTKDGKIKIHMDVLKRVESSYRG